MQLSAPIFRLKRDAKQLARRTSIPLHKALDRVAQGEGFQSWSHLAASSSHSPVRAVLSEIAPHEMVLIGARPGQGKTLLGLELVARADELQRRGYFFTLDYNERDVAARVSKLGLSLADSNVVIDTSDDISADHIAARLGGDDGKLLVVVDYLQLLDQRRTNPSLVAQLDVLKALAAERDAIFVLISQIDRAFDLSEKPMPECSDIRLPNPIDLRVFDRFYFLHEGLIQSDKAA